MNRPLLFCCLWLLGTVPAEAADHVNGDWFILTGKNKVWSSNPDHPAVKDLAKFAKDNWEVRFLVLPADSSYVIHLAGGLWGINSPDSLWKKEDELGKAKLEVKSIAVMAQGGWAVLYDKNGLAEDGVPAAIDAQLQVAVSDVKKAGGTLRSLAFAPDGGWVLLFDKDFKEHGLPQDLSRTLAGHKRQGIGVRCVAFDSQGDWFLLDDGNAWFSSNPNHPASKKLKELRAGGAVLRWIAFTPGVTTHDYTLEHRPVRRIKAVLSLNVENPEGKDQKWAVFAPLGPELPRQRDVKVTLEPAGKAVPDTGPLKQSVLLSLVSDRPKGLQAKVTYEMTLYTNRLVPLLAGQAPPREELPPDLARVYTAATDDLTAKVFQDFLDQSRLRRGAGESDMAFARRAFLDIAQHFQYGANTNGVDTVQSSKGDCGGLSWVFVRAMRANGVPARMLFGRWAASAAPAKDGQPYSGQWHAKAEFFAHGLGWVGVDMSGAVGAVGAKGNPFVAFGNDWGDFVVLDLDVPRRAEVFPGEPPASIGWSQGVGLWSRPDAPGLHTEEGWTVDTLDLHPAPTPFRPGRKAPSPPGPPTLPGKPAPPPPGPAAAAPTRSPAAQRPPELAGAGAPAGGEGKDPDTAKLLPLLLLAPVAAGPLVVLLEMLLIRRRRTPRADPPADVKRRCVRCGAGVRVRCGQVGQRFQCPGCGTVQRIGAC